jgi:hypothetical protein
MHVIERDAANKPAVAAPLNTVPLPRYQSGLLCTALAWDIQSNRPRGLNCSVAFLAFGGDAARHCKILTC